MQGSVPGTGKPDAVTVPPPVLRPVDVGSTSLRRRSYLSSMSIPTTVRSVEVLSTRSSHVDWVTQTQR